MTQKYWGPLPELLQPKEFWQENGITFCVIPITDSVLAKAANESTIHSAVHLQVVDESGELFSIDTLEKAQVDMEALRLLGEENKTSLMRHFMGGREVGHVSFFPKNCGLNEDDRVEITFFLCTEGFMVPQSQ